MHKALTYLIFLITISTSAQKMEVGLPFGHSEGIQFVDISPSSKLFLSASDDNSCIIYDLLTGRSMHRLLGHTEPISKAVFSPDGKMVATASSDKSAKLFDVTSGQLLHDFKGYERKIFDIAFSSDSKKVLFCSFRTAFLMDTETGKEIYQIQNEEWITSVDFNHDDSEILLISEGLKQNTYDATTGESKLDLTGHAEFVLDGSFDFEGARVATSGHDKQVIIYSLVGGEHYVINSFETPAFFIEFSQNSKYLVASEKESAAKVISTENGEVVFTSSPNFKEDEAHFSNDSKYLATSHEVYDVESGKQVFTFPTEFKTPMCCKFSADGKFLISHSYEGVVIYHVGSWEVHRRITSENNALFGATFSNSGSEILVASADKTAKIIDLKTLTVSKSLGGKKDYVIYSKYSPDGKMIALAHRRNNTGVYNTQTGDVIWEFDQESGRTYNVEFNSDGTKLLSATKQTAQEYDLKSGKLIHRFSAASSPVVSVKYNPSETKVVLASQDGNGYVFSTESGELMTTLKGHERDVYYAEFSPDGTKIVTASRDKTVRIWDANSGKELHVLNGHESLVFRAIFDSSGSRVLSWSEDNTAILFDVQKGEIIQQFKGAKSGIRNAIFNGDESQVVLSSLDANLYQYDVNTAELIHVLKGHESEVISANFNQDESRIVSASADGSIIFWDVKTGKQLGRVFTLNNGTEQIIALSEGNYYLMEKESAELIHFTDGKEIYPVEQFDLKFNRPDIVLENLGYVDSSLVLALKNAYLKRLKRMEMDEEMFTAGFNVPEIEITNKDSINTLNSSGKIDVALHCLDKNETLNRINVWLNDVPIYGLAGFSIQDKKANEYQIDLQIDLAEGENKVQFSVLNNAGVESLKQTLYLTSKVHEVKPDLYLVTIGVSKFEQEVYNLTYAAKDAGDMSKAFDKTEVFENVFTKSLVNEEVTLSNVLGLKNFLKTAKIDDQIMIFVAGHGVLSSDLDYFFATHDMNFQKPEEKGLPYQELEGLLDGIKPLKKILIIDACHSGEIDKDEVSILAQNVAEDSDVQFRSVGNAVKNKEGNQSSFELSKSLFADFRKGTGTTVISSASGVEIAMESDVWKNGLFTYCFLDGLTSQKADLNQDGKIMLSELQAYTSKKVFELSKGKQNPTSRIVNNSYDYRIW